MPRSSHMHKCMIFQILPAVLANLGLVGATMGLASSGAMLDVIEDELLPADVVAAPETVKILPRCCDPFNCARTLPEGSVIL